MPYRKLEALPPHRGFPDSVLEYKLSRLNTAGVTQIRPSFALRRAFASLEERELGGLGGGTDGTGKTIYAKAGVRSRFDSFCL